LVADVLFDPTLPIRTKFVEAVLRWNSKRVSLFELSFQARVMLVVPAEVTRRFEGAAGTAAPAVVVAEAMFELPESPAPLVARTRYL
jgi:hypothetical protein